MIGLVPRQHTKLLTHTFFESLTMTKEILFLCLFSVCFCSLFASFFHVFVYLFFFCLFLICQSSRQHRKLLPLTLFEGSTMTSGFLIPFLPLGCQKALCKSFKGQRTCCTPSFRRVFFRDSHAIIFEYASKVWVKCQSKLIESQIC